MLLSLPLLAFALLLLAQRDAAIELRRAFVRAAVLWGVLLVAITEVLSAFSSLTPGAIAIAWGVAAALIAAAGHDRIGRTLGTRVQIHADLEVAAYASAIAIFCLITGYLALATLPAAYDAMTYHLPRVAHWIQDRSLAYYPTNVDRQLWLGPGAELITLNLALLTGSFFLANVPQWLAFVGCALVASLVAKQIGAGRRGQLVACIVCLTTPMAIAEASGAQVDLVGSFWLLCVASLILEETRTSESAARHAVLIGAAAGLAVLTKAVALLFAAPFGVWYLLTLYRRRGRVLLIPVAVAAIVAACVDAGYFARNTALYGTPLGPRGFAGLGNNTHSPRAIVSNVVRNVATQLGTPSDRFNRAIARGVERLHESIGVGVNEQRTTYNLATFRTPRMSFSEGNAGNPLQWILAVIVLIALVSRHPRQWGHPQYLAVALAVSYLLFCFILKWQPASSRLLLPLFCIGAPLAGYALDTMARPALAWMTSAALFLAALPALTLNPARPLIGQRPIWTIPRAEQYVTFKVRSHAPVIKGVAFLSTAGCERIGLYIGPDGWEYPWWTLGSHAGPLPEVRQLNVTDASARTASASDLAFSPCAIVEGDGDVNLPAYIPPQGFRLAFRDQFVKVWLPIDARQR